MKTWPWYGHALCAAGADPADSAIATTETIAAGIDFTASLCPLGDTGNDDRAQAARPALALGYLVLDHGRGDLRLLRAADADLARAARPRLAGGPPGPEGLGDLCC